MMPEVGTLSTDESVLHVPRIAIRAESFRPHVLMKTAGSSSNRCNSATRLTARILARAS